MRRGVWTATLQIVLGLTPLGCDEANSSVPALVARDRPLVDMFSAWTAPGEAEAFQALIDTHRIAHPEARMFNAAASSGSKAREILEGRLRNHKPPDLLQENAHDLRATVVREPGLYAKLDDLIDDHGLRTAILPEILGDVTVNGHIYAMPVNIHRENALFYNQKIFAAHHITPPTTLEEFLSVCKTLKAAGVVPVATAHHGWILRIMFNSIAMGMMGSQHYADFFTGKNKDGLPKLREAITVFGNVLSVYTNPDAAETGFNWTNAAQAVYNGDAAMFLHGDWAKGYFSRLGWKPGVDFGVIGAPGAADMFLYGVDVFAIPAGATNEKGARQFLQTIASKEGQIAFNRLKGSSPIRLDISKDTLDDLGRATLADLEHAKVRMLVRGRSAWDDGIARFAKDHNGDALLQVYVDNPPMH